MNDASVLIVDDSPLDRRLAGGLIEKAAGLRASYAGDGEEALESIARSRPDIVVTDLLMPKIDGLQLVEAVRKRFPLVPIVLMTAHGSEDTAVVALRKGAASYVPKRNLANELVSTLVSVLDVSRGERDEQRVYDLMERSEARYRLGNRPDVIPALVRHIEAQLTRLHLCDESSRLQVAVALREALMNAVVHGSLEVGSELKDKGGDVHARKLLERAQESPFRERTVSLVVTYQADEATFTVEDQGPGFDPAGLPDPTAPVNLDRVHGRGLLLIRTFMDEVRHNERGNVIVMIKRRCISLSS